MDRRSVSRSPTGPEAVVARLVEEGYCVALLDGMLVVSDVPYVHAAGSIATADLVVPLAMSGGTLIAPTTHHAWWTGGRPCETNGSPIRTLNVAGPATFVLHGLPPAMVICAMAQGREYVDYDEFVATYVALLGTPAAAIDPKATARTWRRPVSVGRRRDPFVYTDTASTRAGLVAANDALHGRTIGIVGLGGTGSYVLDLVAKTGVDAIHLFDDDEFEQHSAFRAPGASTIDDIRARSTKVDHFAAVYGAMHRGIVPHRRRIDSRTAPLLDVLDFVFLCIDDAAAKPAIMGRLAGRRIPYVDVGMGLHLTEHGVAGAVRTTMVHPDNVGMVERIPTTSDREGVYGTNLQIAELNALNASLAVIAWKRHCGFYAAGRRDGNSVFVVDSGLLHNEPAAP